MSTAIPPHTLLAVEPDGSFRFVWSDYAGLKTGLHDATFDFIVANEHVAFFVDDEGLLKGEALNVPASTFIGRALYGPVVLVSPYPVRDGETKPAEDHVTHALIALCQMWQGVVESATQVGQDITVHADPATIPPPTIISLDDDAFERYLETGEVPK